MPVIYLLLFTRNLFFKRFIYLFLKRKIDEIACIRAVQFESDILLFKAIFQRIKKLIDCKPS